LTQEKLPVAKLLQGIHLISLAKNGIIALELKRYTGPAHPTGWKTVYNQMEAINDRDGECFFVGSSVLMIPTLVERSMEAVFVGNWNNNIPFVAALVLNDAFLLILSSLIHSLH